MRCKSDRCRFLYGPKRETASNPFKEFMMKSSIFSEDISHNEDRMGTTTSACFGAKSIELDRETAKLSTEIQRTSNFKFGGDENYPLITTKISEFSEHVLPPVKRVVQDMYSTNIPDFSPSHTKDKMITDGGSVYVGSYKTPKTCSKSLRRSKEHLKDQTEDMRSTHFDFGCHKQRKCSETLHSYNERNYADPNRDNEPRVVSPSSVFRDGDWNMRGHGMTYTSSVSHDHYSSSKEKRNHSAKLDEKGGLQDEGIPHLNSSTNFKLGRDKYLISSLYKKDFRQLEFETPQYPLKTMREVRPKSAKVLNQTSTRMCPSSTEQSDFVYRHEEADDFLKKRGLEYMRNQEKDKICSVVLNEEDNDRRKYIKPLSMSEKDYQLPPIELLRQHKIYHGSFHNRQYNCIIMDKCSSDEYQKTSAACKTLTSSSVEKKEQLANQKKEKRQRDDHHTHFTFGSDVQRYPNSEQHDQFVRKGPMDSLYHSAEAFKNRKGAHIGRDVSKSPFPQLSVMKADYQTSSKLSPCQRRLVNLSLKYPTVIAPSHYFHKDHERGKRISTTRTDYAPPELMTV